MGENGCDSRVCTTLYAWVYWGAGRMGEHKKMHTEIKMIVHRTTSNIMLCDDNRKVVRMGVVGYRYMY